MAEEAVSSSGSEIIAKTGKRRLKGRSKKSSPHKKKKVITDLPLADSEIKPDKTNTRITDAVSGAYALKDLPPYSAAYTSLNLFRSAISKDVTTNPKAEQNYTPALGEMKHIRDYPVIRDYKLVRTKDGAIPSGSILRNGEILTGKNGASFKNGTRHKIYRISAVWDQHLSHDKKAPERIDFFTRPASETKPFDCVVDERVCPTPDDVEHLARIVVDYTNRLPRTCDLTTMTAGLRDGLQEMLRSPVNKFVEINALLDYNPELDWSAAIGSPFFETKDCSFRSNLYSTTVAQLYMQFKQYTHQRPPVVFLLLNDDGSLPTKDTFSGTNVSTKLPEQGGYSVSPAEIPAAHAAILPRPTPFKKEYDEAWRLHIHHLSQLFGFIGTHRQWVEEWRLRLHLAGIIPSREKQWNGPFANLPLFIRTFNVQNVATHIVFHTKAIEHALIVPEGLVGSGYKSGSAHSIGSSVSGLRIVTAAKDYVLIAYIKAEVLRSIQRGEGLLNAILAGHVAAGDVDIGLVDAQKILHHYAASAEFAELTTKGFESICMGCTTPILAIDLIVDEHGRLLCRICTINLQGESAVRLKQQTVYSRFKRLVHQGIYQENREVDDLYTIDKQMAFVAVEHQIVNKTTWFSECSDGLKTLESAHWNDGPLRDDRTGMRFSHPAQPSFGKVYPLWIDDGTTMHNSKNVFMQNKLEQDLQGTRIIGIMPYLGKAAALTLARRVKDADSSNDAQSMGYHEEDVAFFEVLHIAADNAWRIVQSIPHAKKLRVKQELWTKKTFMTKLLPMLKSSVWDGKIMTKAQQNFVARSAMSFIKLGVDQSVVGRGGQIMPRKNYQMWSGRDLARVKKNVAAIIKPGGKFNKHGIDLSAVINKDGSVWLGRDEERPMDADLHFEFFEARTRLWTMTEHCNGFQDTQESPETLMYEAIIQTIETRGKCHMFGFRLSLLCRHPQNASWGRGLYRLDKNGVSDLQSPIKAGEPMATGCVSKGRKDIEAEYDYTRRTIVRESWAANQSRSNYPAEGQVLIPMLQELAGKVQPIAKWCDVPRESKEDFYRVPLRWSWKAQSWGRHATARDGMNPRTSVADSDEGSDVEDLYKDPEEGDYEAEEMEETADIVDHESLVDDEEDPDVDHEEDDETVSHSSQAAATTTHDAVEISDDHKSSDHDAGDPEIVAVHEKADLDRAIEASLLDQTHHVPNLLMDTETAVQTYHELRQEDFTTDSKESVERKMYMVFQMIDAKPTHANDPKLHALAETIAPIFTAVWNKHRSGASFNFRKDDILTFRRRHQICAFLHEMAGRLTGRSLPIADTVVGLIPRQIKDNDDPAIPIQLRNLMVHESSYPNMKIADPSPDGTFTTTRGNEVLATWTEVSPGYYEIKSMQSE